MLIPTPRALEKKVAPALAVLKKTQTHVLLDKLERRVEKLESGFRALDNRLLDEKSMEEFHQTMGIARVVLKEWREKQGYTGSPPDGPPRSRHGMWASSPKDREVKP
jgi:hypothetical protein